MIADHHPDVRCTTVAGDADRFRVLVAGSGVADGRRRPWAHLVRALPPSATLYLADSSAVRTEDEARQSFEWQLTVNRPHVVIRVVDHAGGPGTDRAIDARVAALAEDPTTITLGVTYPWSDPDHTVRYNQALAIGAGAPALDAPRVTRLPLLVNGALLRCGADHPAPAVDVLLYGPRSDAASKLAAGLRRLRLEVGYLHPSWDDEDDARGRALGRWPMAYRSAAFGRAGIVVALPDGVAHRERQRALEAMACGAPTVIFGAGDDPEQLGVPSVHDAEGVRRAATSTGRSNVEDRRDATRRWREVLDVLDAEAASLESTPRAWEEAPAHAVKPRRAGRVAFFMPAYNNVHYLDTAARSVLEQTVADVELLILDDGSVDGTWDLACALAATDHRVRAFRQANVGQIGRFDLLHQQIANHTNAPLVAFLGADDVAAPQRIERQLALFDDESVDVCYSAAFTMDGDGRRTDLLQLTATPLDRWSVSRKMLRRDGIGHPTVVQRRSTFDRFGPYNRGFASDYDFWFKAASFARYRCIDERLVAYRIHNGSSSNASGRSRAEIEGLWIRGANLEDFSLRDLYPELGRLDDFPAGVSAALTHLALDLATIDPARFGARIVQACDRSELAGPSVLARFARAIGFAGLGRAAEAERALRKLADLGFEPAQTAIGRLAEAALHDEPFQNTLPAGLAFPALHSARPEPDDLVWRSNGSTRATTVLWCEIDWRRPDIAAPVVQTFCRRFSSDEDVQLALVRAGDAPPPAQAIGLLSSITAPLGALVDGAADLTLVDAGERPGDAIDLPARSIEEVAEALDRLESLHRRLLFGSASVRRSPLLVA